jgi:transcriptional regulator with XRE-family HTH domain
MVNFFKEERKRQRKSIKEISDISGVSISTINKWEYCGVMPTVDNFQKVLNALGYDLRIVKKGEDT